MSPFMRRIFSHRIFAHIAAGALLGVMLFLAGGAALRESPTVDEIAHIGAGISYLQRLDLRLNPEHPPLAKVLAAAPLVIGGVQADYSSDAWKIASDFFRAYACEWIFGDAVLGRWNPWRPVVLWARAPMLALTLLLGWMVYLYGGRLGGPWGGLLCLAFYVTTPAFLVFGPLVITDVPVTLFSLVALWQFAEVWVLPSRRNALLLGLAVAGALLSKFTGLLLFLVIVAVFVYSRFRPSDEEPRAHAERKLWRRARWHCVFRSVLWAGLFVYVVYFFFSLHQPDDALDRIGSGSWAFLLRRPLMPFWLYLRGLLLMLLTGSRPTFLLGHTYPHGVPFYFPIVFGLKSTEGFLLALVMAAAAGITFRATARKRSAGATAIPAAFRPHWRVVIIGFFVYLIVCLASQLDMSIRHFSVPVVLLILMLAPVPRMLAALPNTVASLPNMLESLPLRRLMQGVLALLVASSFVVCISAYPFLLPFVNSFGFGHPAFTLVNDSNVSWNEALPEVEDFAERRGLSRIELDWASLSDPALIAPQAQPWDCQAPTGEDAGRWVAVAAVSILENHNCGYLLGYPHEALAGGSMYAFRLPPIIPPAGSPSGPPLPAARKHMWMSGFDIRAFAVDSERHPETFRAGLEGMMRAFQAKRTSGGK